MAPRNRDVAINMSGISVGGVGGLGLVTVAGLMTYVFPQAWWLVLFGAVGGVLRTEDGGRSAFSHLALKRITGDRLTDKILTRHAANLIAADGRRKRMRQLSNIVHFLPIARRNHACADCLTN